MNTKELETRIEKLERQVTLLVLKSDIDYLKHLDAVDKGGLFDYETPKYEFKVGDRVQFKSWEEMENKYGLDSRAEQANIKTNPRFLNSMSYLCGTYARIKKINGKDVKLKDFTSRGYTGWSFSIDMIKPANEPKFKVGDKVKIIRGLWKGEIVEITTINSKDFSYGIKQLKQGWYSALKEENLEPYTEPRWTFTDDEKVILRNLPEGYKWIARDKGSRLWVCSNKPHKEQESWANGVFWENLTVFYNLFQSIKWEDDEACEFRKYL